MRPKNNIFLQKQNTILLLHFTTNPPSLDNNPAGVEVLFTYLKKTKMFHLIKQSEQTGTNNVTNMLKCCQKKEEKS